MIKLNPLSGQFDDVGFPARTITGTANQITVTNGDGVAGNPTLALPQNIHTGATPTFAGGTFTGTVSGITKSMVGLGNVDNTSDADKPVSTATQTALDGKANASHTHGVADLAATGTPSATTYLRGDGTWATPAGGGWGYSGVALRPMPSGTFLRSVPLSSTAKTMYSPGQYGWGYPIPFGHGAPVPQVGFYVSTAGAAGEQARIAAYHSGPDGMPTTVLAQGNVSVDSIGYKYITVNAPLEGTLLWVFVAALANSQTAAIWCVPTGVVPGVSLLYWSSDTALRAGRITLVSGVYPDNPSMVHHDATAYAVPNWVVRVP